MAAAFEQTLPEELRTHRCCSVCPWPRRGGIVGQSVWCAGVKNQAANQNGPNAENFKLAKYTSRPFPALCLVGPDFSCLMGTHSCILVPSCAFFVLVAPNVHPALGGIGLLGFIITLILLGATACVDPGIIGKQTEEEYTQFIQTAPRGEEPLSTCSYCNVLRPRGTIHCPDCNVCVMEMDHHCPWTGKCIGKYNIRQFYAFNISWPLLCIYVAVISGYYIFWQIPQNKSNNWNFDGAFTIAPQDVTTVIPTTPTP